VLRLAELEEEGGAVTNDTNGTKAVADGDEAPRTGNGDVAAEELEDGEVDEGGDVNLASNEGAGGRASKGRTIGRQLPPSKSTAASTEDQRKQRAPESLESETDVLAETTEATGPGRTAIPLPISNLTLCWLCFSYFADYSSGSRSSPREHQDGILVGGLLFRPLRGSTAGQRGVNTVTNVCQMENWFSSWSRLWRGAL
jgi:hypothetical protein